VGEGKGWEGEGKRKERGAKHRREGRKGRRESCPQFQNPETATAVLTLFQYKLKI